MPTFSSDQFHKEWVYAIKQDFRSAEGTPAIYASGAPFYWDSERAKIQPGPVIECVSLNSDATLLAVTVAHDIHVYETEGWSLQQVLRGHTSVVSVVAFQPGDPNKLVSCAMKCRMSEEPTIMLWDLDNPQQRHPLETEAAVHALGGRAVASIVTGLEDSQSKWTLNDTEKATLLDDIQHSITKLNVKYPVRDVYHLSGRLLEHFQSQVFSRDGSSMIYLPGPSPKSNSVDDWDICVWDTAKREVRLRLKGHTDAIMWTGFSPQNTLLGTVSWDKTMRIWNAASGALIHMFTTKTQNWTGDFSPDSHYFAGTCGNGDVYIWDLETGAEVVLYHFSSRSGHWCRALDWSPNGTFLAIGGQPLGRIVVFDVQAKKVVQERLLSTEASPEEHRRLMRGFLEAHALKFLPGGRKIAYQTTADEGLEVYDFVDNRKWRFAPQKGQGEYGPGFIFLAKQGALVSVNWDALRVWDLPPSEGDEWSMPNSRD